MKKQILWLALGAAALGCGNDHTTASASTNPVPESCSKGSISTGDVKTGTLNRASCARCDHAYTEDSMPFDSYSFKAEQGKGYWFALDAADDTTSWDAVLELVTVDPATREEQLLSISDDEWPARYSRMYFTSTDFVPAFQVYGPGWGLTCLYAYQGCGGGVAGVSKSNSKSFTINASGDENCGGNLVPPDRNGPSASVISASPNNCEFYNWSGLYTITVGTFFNESGTFTLDVTEGSPGRLVGPDTRLRNPTLEFLRKKPFNASHYLRRVS